MKIDDSLAQVIDKLSSVVDSHGTEAILLGGRVLQLTVAAWMIAATVGFLAGLFSLTRFLHWYRDPSWIADSKSDPPAQVVAWGISTFVFGLIGGGSFVAYVLSPLNWAILFDARLAVAARVLGLI